MLGTVPVKFEDHVGLAVSTPLALLKSQTGRPALPTAKSRSPSPSTSPQAILSALAITLDDQSGMTVTVPPSLLKRRLGWLSLPAARSRSPSPSTSPIA